MTFTYLPARLGQGLRDPAGQALLPRVRLTPSAPMRNGTTTVGPAQYTVAADGTLSGPVAATDDPGTTPQGVAYYVEVVHPSAPTRAWWVQIPHAATSPVDLEALAPLTVPPALVDSALVAHIAATTGVHGIPDTAALETVSGSAAKVSAHVAATDPHGDRAYAASLLGSGASTAVTLARTADGALSGHRAVTPTGTTSAAYASNTTPAHATRPLWLTQGAAASGAAVTVTVVGVVVEPSWSWTPGVIYLGAAGLLTQTPPTLAGTAVFLAVLGYALDATSMMFDPRPSITLS